MSFKGMDADALRAFAARLDGTADQLQQAHSGLGGQLRQVAWHGAVAERFTGDWFGAYQSQVSGACAQLTGLAQSLRAEAQEQDAASGSNGLGLGLSLGRPWPSRFGDRGGPRLGPNILPIDQIRLLPGVLIGLAPLIPNLIGRGHPPLGRGPEPKRPTPVQRIVTLARGGSITKDAAWAAHASATSHVEGHTKVGGVAVEGSATATATANAYGHAHGSISKHGLDASAEAGGGVAATAAVAGAIGSRNLGVSGGAAVKATASARAGASGHIDQHGVQAKVGGEVDASVSANAHATAHLGGVDTTVGVHAYAGFHAHAEAEATATTQDVKVHVSGGVALLIGAGVDYTVKVHPAQVLHNFESVLAPQVSMAPHLVGGAVAHVGALAGQVQHAAHFALPRQISH